MALEIKELIVKVRVNEETQKVEQSNVNVDELKNQIIDECLFQLEERLTIHSER